MVVMRALHEMLVEEKGNSDEDLLFLIQLKKFEKIKSNQIYITQQKNLSEFEQLWEISSKCTPSSLSRYQ